MDVSIVIFAASRIGSVAWSNYVDSVSISIVRLAPNRVSNNQAFRQKEVDPIYWPPRPFPSCSSKGPILSRSWETSMPHPG